MINKYFKPKGIRVIFIDKMHSPSADLIICDFDSDFSPFFCHLISDSSSTAKVIVIDYTLKHALTRFCSNIYGYVQCKGKNLNGISMELYDLLTSFLSCEENGNIICKFCKDIKLTKKEFEVIYLLWCGNKQSLLPKIMKCDRRTISQHKRSAMYKLYKADNILLYRWLNQIDFYVLGLASPECWSSLLTQKSPLIRRNIDHGYCFDASLNS